MCKLSNIEPKSKKIDQGEKWSMENPDVRQDYADTIISECPLHLLSVLSDHKYLPYCDKYVTRP